MARGQRIHTSSTGDGAGERPYRTLSEWLIRQLRDEIRTGRLPGGAHLRQAEIAERYGVSSTPVREAFAALQRQGLLESTAHKGVVVSNPTLADLRENYEIRVALESLATRLATPNLTDDDLDNLSALLDEMGSLSFEGDGWTRFYRLNEVFHDTIYAGAGRPRLGSLIVELRNDPASFVRLFSVYKPDHAITATEHEAILDACRARDAERAGAAMASHLEHTVEIIARALAVEAEASSA